MQGLPVDGMRAVPLRAVPEHKTALQGLVQLLQGQPATPCASNAPARARKLRRLPQP